MECNRGISIKNARCSPRCHWRIVANMPGRPISVAETSLFVRQAAAVWDDAERESFVNFLARHPKAGDVIPDTGGVRKLRWGRPGMGKRGGVRVIYFYHDENQPLYLLMVYAKARREDMTADEKKIARQLAATLKGSARTRSP